MKPEALILNLFGGPGLSKSTTAAGVFYRLKQQGVNCELVTEYAKDKTWQGDHTTLRCQPYVTGKQLFRLFRVASQVDVVVTDSPLLLGLVYAGFGSTPSFASAVLEQFNLFHNLNFLLSRNTEIHPYNVKGRSQSEAEAIEKDREIKALLERYAVPCQDVPVLEGDATIDCIVSAIRTAMAKRGETL